MTPAPTREEIRKVLKKHSTMSEYNPLVDDLLTLMSKPKKLTLADIESFGMDNNCVVSVRYLSKPVPEGKVLLDVTGTTSEPTGYQEALDGTVADLKGAIAQKEVPADFPSDMKMGETRVVDGKIYSLNGIGEPQDGFVGTTTRGGAADKAVSCCDKCLGTVTFFREPVQVAPYCKNAACSCHTDKAVEGKELYSSKTEAKKEWKFRNRFPLKEDNIPIDISKIKFDEAPVVEGNPECKKCGLLKSTIIASGTSCAGRGLHDYGNEAPAVEGKGELFAPDCGHQCSGNCRRVGCNCLCGEWHGKYEEEAPASPSVPSEVEWERIVDEMFVDGNMRFQSVGKMTPGLIKGFISSLLTREAQRVRECVPKEEELPTEDTHAYKLGWIQGWNACREQILANLGK